MLHPSYSDLIKIVNEEAEGDTPVVNSRYSIVMATAKRARQIISDPKEPRSRKQKPLSEAVLELQEGILRILPDEENPSEVDSMLAASASFSDSFRDPLAYQLVGEDGSDYEESAENDEDTDEYEDADEYEDTDEEADEYEDADEEAEEYEDADEEAEEYEDAKEEPAKDEVTGEEDPEK